MSSVLNGTGLATTTYYNFVDGRWCTCVFYQRTSDNTQAIGDPVYPINQITYEPPLEPRIETVTMMAKKTSPITCTSWTSWTNAETPYTQINLYFVDDRNQIIECTKINDQVWRPGPLGISTIINNLSANSDLTVTSFGEAHSRNIHLYYINSHGQICELIWRPKKPGRDKWEVGTSQLPNSHTDSITVASVADGDLRLYYQEDDFCIRESCGSSSTKSWAKGGFRVNFAGESCTSAIIWELGGIRHFRILAVHVYERKLTLTARDTDRDPPWQPTRSFPDTDLPPYSKVAATLSNPALGELCVFFQHNDGRIMKLSADKYFLKWETEFVKM